MDEMYIARTVLRGVYQVSLSLVRRDVLCRAIRGLPGSGKSTMAQVYRRNGFTWVEADMYFDSFLFGYRLDPAKLPEAHSWCQTTVERYLSQGL